MNLLPIKKTVLILFGSILLSSPVYAVPQSSPFTDIPTNSPYFTDIINLYKKGLIQGYDDKTFRPDQLITRAEFVKLVLGAGQCLDCSNPPDDIKNEYRENPFPDVPFGAWYFYCVSHGKKIGIIMGYLGYEKKGLFVPEDPISRAESIAILLRASGISPAENDPMVLYDVLDEAWYKGYVKQAVLMNLISYHNGFVAPEEKIQRGEFAHLANIVLNKNDCKEIKRGNVNDNNNADISNANQNINVTPSDTNENKNVSLSDRDNDGIFDKDDFCPDVPGDLKNATMSDGCPKVSEKYPADVTPKLIVTRPFCNTCPCPTLDFQADIRAGDIIFSIIADDGNEKIYTKSNLWYVVE